jgi:cyclopropane fatty-acyl-phospholipid synthase-like methyltransferase
LENPDPFNYQFAAYERRKYHKTLETVLKWRSGAESVLELGCSIGVFTQMLANYFVRVTALDISNEACGMETFAHRMKVSIKRDGTNRGRSGGHRRAHVEMVSCVRNRFRMG